MAIVIVVEDGSIVPNANSYISLADARTQAEQLGITLPSDDDEASLAIVQGAEYVNSFEPQMCGSRVSKEQSMAYPRHGVCINGFHIASDEIPTQLIKAQLYAAEDFGNGGSAWGGNDDGKAIKKEKVDVLEVEYQETGVTGSSYSIPKVDSYMQPLLCSGQGANFNVYRV